MKNLEEFDKEAYRKRIRTLRKLYGLNQVAFAKMVGIPYKRWHHYESGYPIPRDTAFILRRTIPEISTDWIWWGDEGNMKEGTLKRIHEIQNEEAKLGPPLVGEREYTRVVRPPRRGTKKKKKTTQLYTSGWLKVIRRKPP